MNKIPLVSVITIFLNGEQFIEEAIKSVLSQSYLNWELLLIDDGSTDGSTQLAQYYVERYPEKIRYLEHKGHTNRGMSASRNLGFGQARGEYIAFVDADDVLLCDKLERQVAILEAQPEAAMVYGPTLLWYSWTGKPEDVKRDKVLELGFSPETLVKPPAILLQFLQRKNNSPGTCNVLIRSEAVVAVGGCEEAFYSTYEDQVFFAKICLKFPVFVSGRCSAKYRQHSASATSRTWESKFYHPDKASPARHRFLSWLENYLKEQGENASSKEVWQATQKELWPYHHARVYRLEEGLKIALRPLLPASLRNRLHKILFKKGYSLKLFR